MITGSYIPGVALDLSSVTPPDALEELDYEDILAARKADLIDRMPELEDVLALESEPATKILEESAYRETVLRNRVNEAVRALLLAQARLNDLDNLAANRSLTRLDGETDARLRNRTQQAFWLVSAAGPASYYVEIAKAVDASIVDVAPISLYAGNITLTVLAPQEVAESDASAEEIAYGSRVFSGITPAAGNVVIIARNNSDIINRVRQAIESDDVQPFTDMPEVRAPTIKPYQVQAVLTLYPGPDEPTVLNTSLSDLNDYINKVGRIGYDATEAGITDAIVVPGVQNAALEWSEDIVCSALELAVCTDIAITVAEARNV